MEFFKCEIWPIIPHLKGANTTNELIISKVRANDIYEVYDEVVTALGHYGNNPKIYCILYDQHAFRLSTRLCTAPVFYLTTRTLLCLAGLMFSVDILVWRWRYSG